MSDKNDINKFIQKKAKLDTIQNENEKDDSFNQLLNLQLLIQKHTGLTELCKTIFYFTFFLNSYKRKTRFNN